MKKHLITYLDEYGFDALYISTVSDVLSSAVRDNTKELIVSKEEYYVIQRFMVYSGSWNWDQKTFMGINIIIK